MSNSLCKYGNKCRNNQKKEKILKITENSITCNNISNSNKKKCITNNLVQNVVSNAVGEDKTIGNNFDLNLFKSELDRVCLQKEKNGKFASLDECKTKVELKTDMVFKEDTITMDKQKSKVYKFSDTEHYYDLYIDFTKFFENIFKKNWGYGFILGNGVLRQKKINEIKTQILEKFEEKNKIYNVKLKNKGKIKKVEFKEIENLVNNKKIKKFYLIVTFNKKDFFSNIVWNGKIKNSLRLTKGKIEEALKTKVHGISLLNNSNLFYRL